MEPVTNSTPAAENTGSIEVQGMPANVEGFGRYLDEIFGKVNKLETKVNEIEQFYSSTNDTQLNTPKHSSVIKDRAKERHVSSIEKQQQDALHREAAATKRMQELMRQFEEILCHITQHDWAHPFMHPVDVEGLKLHDYYKIIKKPMDFSTIKDKMDGNGYKNVREIYADVRLVFKNAMKYNDERHDVHVMAKYLLDKFEEKWLQLLPKVAKEEKRRAEEEAKAQIDLKLSQEVVHANMTRELSHELFEVDMQLEKLRQTVVQQCRKMSTEEKKKLGTALGLLSAEDLTKALEIVAENNPGFLATAQEVDLDIDAQSEITLWRLKVFVQNKLRQSGKSSEGVDGNNINDHTTKSNSKRKGDNANSASKNAMKRSRKATPNS